MAERGLDFPPPPPPRPAPALLARQTPSWWVSLAGLGRFGWGRQPPALPAAPWADPVQREKVGVPRADPIGRPCSNRPGLSKDGEGGTRRGRGGLSSLSAAAPRLQFGGPCGRQGACKAGPMWGSHLPAVQGFSWVPRNRGLPPQNARILLPWWQRGERLLPLPRPSAPRPALSSLSSWFGGGGPGTATLWPQFGPGSFLPPCGLPGRAADVLAQSGEHEGRGSPG